MACQCTGSRGPKPAFLQVWAPQVTLGPTGAQRCGHHGGGGARPPVFLEALQVSRWRRPGFAGHHPTGAMLVC